MTEQQTIQEILRGNRDRYRELVERHQSMIFRTCMGFLHHKEEAEDLTQDVFIQAYQSLERFRGNAAFSTWLYRIAVNACLNKLRKSRGNPILRKIESAFNREKDTVYHFPVPPADDPEHLLITAEHREWVSNALDSLPEKQRTAIVLSHYDELPQKEIAAIMQITEGAVEALIQRAKANLRIRLAGLYKKIEK